MSILSILSWVPLVYLLFTQVFVATPVPPDDEADEDEGHGRHDHQAVVLVADAVEAEFLHDGVAPEGAAAEELTDEAEGDEDDAVAEAVAESVEETRPRLLHHGESLEAAHDDAVGDDETHEDGELLADVVDVGFQHLVDQHHEGGDDQHTLKFKKATIFTRKKKVFKVSSNLK